MWQVPTEEPGSLLQVSEEQQENAGKPTARFTLAARVLAAAGLGLAIMAAVHAGRSGENPMLSQLPQSQLPPPPVHAMPADTKELISLATVDNPHWKIGKPHQSCNDVCAGHGEHCSEVALKAVDTKEEVQYAASVANHDCKGSKGWKYDFSPSVCTHYKCCGDGSCQGACTYGNNGKRSCAAPGSAHNSRLCPCIGGHVPVPTEPPLGKVIELDHQGLASLYSKHEDFLIFLTAPWCGICRGLGAPGGKLEQVAKLLAPAGIKTYRMDTERQGMPAGYPCRYACEYFFVHHGSEKSRWNGHHNDAAAIKRFCLKR